jgi:mannose-1-phosphate guanylyltransferase
MKAFLLAAGLGTRLRPLTNHIPKCMLPVQGKPLLAWWFDLFHKHQVTEVIVNTHYLPEKVRSFISEYNAQKTGLIVHEFYEETLLGSGGTVYANEDFIGQDKDFLICNADNLTDIDLTKMLRFHDAHDGLLTMALFRAGQPEQCGIPEMNQNNLIISFEEKPQHPRSDLANAGIYIARREIFQTISPPPLADFGRDILPCLIGRMYGFPMQDYLIDIGTPDNYEKAQREWMHDHF